MYWLSFITVIRPGWSQISTLPRAVRCGRLCGGSGKSVHLKMPGVLFSSMGAAEGPI